MARPVISAEERRRVAEVLRSGRLAAGPVVAEFEEAFAAYIGAPHVVMTSSGTSALQAALVACAIGRGDKVLTTPLSFVATATAITSLGAVPVFVDVEPATGNIDPQALEEAVAEHPDARALLVVHLYGHPADMPAILSVADRAGLIVIEDCAQAHGAAIGEKRAGCFGHAAAFSFYATKNMTTGEGGAVVTAEPEVAERARLFINHGQRERYLHESLGLNLRMTDLQAAIGLGQLRRLPRMNARRQAHAAYFDGHIDNPAVEKPGVRAGYVHVYHQYTVRVDGRDRFVKHLNACGVAAAVHYPLTIPEQPCYRSLPCVARPCPVAEGIARRVVSIPVHAALTLGELRRVVAAVNSFAPDGR